MESLAQSFVYHHLCLPRNSSISFWLAHKRTHTHTRARPLACLLSFALTLAHQYTHLCTHSHIVIAWQRLPKNKNDNDDDDNETNKGSEEEEEENSETVLKDIIEMRVTKMDRCNRVRSFFSHSAVHSLSLSYSFIFTMYIFTRSTLTHSLTHTNPKMFRNALLYTHTNNIRAFFWRVCVCSCVRVCMLFGLYFYSIF